MQDLNKTLSNKLGLSSTEEDSTVFRICGEYMRIYSNCLLISKDEKLNSILKNKLEELTDFVNSLGTSSRSNDIFEKNRVPKSGEYSVEHLLSNQTSLTHYSEPSFYNAIKLQINSLTYSPRKNYLEMCSIYGSKKHNMETFDSFAACISNAIKEDPNNPVYKYIAHDILEATSSHKRGYRTQRKKEVTEFKKKKAKTLFTGLFVL